MSYRDWIELESDPGLFTLLVHDFGVKNVEVEEVYDLSKPIERPVYGFIFLFKWTEERKSRRKAIPMEENFVLDEEVESDMFFAQQIIPNSCASHALLSVLLNRSNIDLGYTLKQLRDSCEGLDSESKGLAIGNFWNIAVAHNNHGRPELHWQSSNLKNVTAASRSMEAFHYVSYIPHKMRLFELDGLKPHPIDHGPWSEDESWSDKARQVIQKRILFATGGEYSHDIRYNLLAVVPEKREEYRQKMEIFSYNKKVLIELFKVLACKESFISEEPSAELFKFNFVDHPFRQDELHKIKYETDSQSETCSATLSGQESPSCPFSDSEDSSVSTYRVKSIMRSEMKGLVFVYGDSLTESNEQLMDQNKVEKTAYQMTEKRPEKGTELTTKTEEDMDVLSNAMNLETMVPIAELPCTPDREVKEKCEMVVENDPSIGVEIIADDTDINSLLDQNKVQRLSLEKLLKYGDQIKVSDLQKCMQDLDELYKSCELSYKEEIEKIEEYKVDDYRRRHNYDPFITTFLSMLADQDLLEKLLKQQNNVIKKVVGAVSKGSNCNNGKKEMISSKKKKRR